MNLKIENKYFVGAWRNHSNKIITIGYESEKRHKTKIRNFLKKEHQESKINEFLKQYGLKMEHYCKSIRYTDYIIVDL